MTAPAKQVTGGWWAFCNHRVHDGKVCGIRVWIRASTHQNVPIPRHTNDESGAFKHEHRGA